MKRSLLLALACLALLLALFSTPLALPARADTALSQADLDALALKGEALPPALAAKIAPDLLRSLYAEPAADAPEHPKDAPEATFLVVLRDQADLEPAARIAARAERRWAVYDALRQTAERSQQDMVAALAALQAAGHVRAFQSFFIFNGLAVTGDLHALLSLAARPEVAYIYPNRTHTLPPRPASGASSAAEPDA
ncbi:MAG: hypothetical protein GXY76_11140, partial [Chloroflexi bacterium]|nr:hypothetical protein [Chloroflexota bacterium]